MSDVGRYRKVFSNEWLESAFQSLSDAERVVYFYLRTGPQSTSVGVYRLSTALAVEDLGNLTPAEFELRLNAVCDVFGWPFDPQTRVLWLTDWLDVNPPQSPNVCVSWRKLLDNLPNCDLKFDAAAALVARLKEMPKAFGEAFGELPKDSRISKGKPKAKPKAQPESNQGSGIQGSLDSGSREQAALRAGAENGNGNGSYEPSWLDRVVMRASQHYGRQSDLEFKLDTIRQCLDVDKRASISRQELLTALARVESRPS